MSATEWITKVKMAGRTQEDLARTFKGQSDVEKEEGEELV